jgi:glycosyltransferase involved in cell wall biosynthesis
MKYRRQVLIISYQFPPDIGSIQRVKKFVKYLPDYGWQPIVITRNINDYRVADLTSLEDINLDVPIIRTGLANLIPRIKKALSKRKKKSSSFAGDRKQNKKLNDSIQNNQLKYSVLYHKLVSWFIWPDRAIGWLPFAFIAALKVLSHNRISAVYIVSPPHSMHLLGVLLQSITKVKWVADFRDPWSNDPDIAMPSPIHKFAHQKAEKVVIKSARKTITTTKYHAKYFENIIPLNAKNIAVIPNGYDQQDFKDLQGYTRTGFTITYAGGFYASRTVTPFLKALSIINNEYPEILRNTIVQFIGNGQELIREELKQYNFSEIFRFLGYMDHTSTIKVLNQSAILLLVVHSDSIIAQLCIPAKLFEYMALQRPILAISPLGAAAEIVKSSGIGAVVDPKNIREIADSILKYYREYVKSSSEKYSVPEHILLKYERKELTRQLSFILNEISQVEY